MLCNNNNNNNGMIHNLNYKRDKKKLVSLIILFVLPVSSSSHADLNWTFNREAGALISSA